MNVDNTLSLLYFVLAIAAVWIAAMLTWLLFEAALMVHRANQAVKGVMDKAMKVERAILSIKDKLESSSGYLGMLAEGGKMMMDMMGKRKKKRRRKDDDEE